MATIKEVLESGAAWCVERGDALDVLGTVPDDVGGALIADPPAGIGFMGKGWDAARGGRESWIAWLTKILAQGTRTLRPGGRSLVWSLPRTSHWTGCAVYDAGLNIETSVLHLFGQGWPKGKSQLKPAHELWWLARKGPSEPLGIDACRVGMTKEVPASTGKRNLADLNCGWGLKAKSDTDGRNPNMGRWPSTVVLSHTPWCRCVGTRKVTGDARQGGGQRPGGFYDTGSDPGDGKPCAPGHADPDGTETVDAWECVEGCPVAAVNEASGRLTSGTGAKVRRSGSGYRPNAYGASSRTEGESLIEYGDTGTAARFWQQFPFEDPEAPSLLVYAPKVSPSERWCLSVCGCGARAMLLDAVMARTEARPGPDGEAADTCVDCNKPRVVHVHPTQKGVALMRWLVRLVTRPGDLVIDPFCGSGTTGVAAVMEGRRFLGIELDAEGEGHVDVARERIRSAFLVGPRSTKRSFVRDSQAQAQARIESGAKYEQKAFKF